MANMSYNDGAELFLDILTKEEKEALLTQKMQAIRKKNDILRIRHEEIQLDMRNSGPMLKHLETGSQALALKQAAESPRKGAQSPKKEMKPQNGEEWRDGKDHSEKSPEKKAPKFVAGRGKQLAHMSKQKLKAQGPPPDPQYNFLSDHTRDKPQGAPKDKKTGGERKSQSRGMEQQQQQ